MIRSPNQVVRAALVLVMCLFGAAAWAKTKDVAITYDHSAGCVTKITVQPYTIEFDSLAHIFRLGNSKVHWKINDRGNPEPNTEFLVQKEVAGTSYAICKDTYEFTQNLAPCKAKNKFLADSVWKYTVAARKTDGTVCPAAVVDPEIIFKKRKLTVLILLIVVLVVGVLAYAVIRARRSAN